MKTTSTFSRPHILRLKALFGTWRKVSKFTKTPVTSLFRIANEKSYYEKKPDKEPISPREKRYILNKLKTKPFYNAKETHRELNLQCSYYYFLKFLKDNGFGYIKPQIKPFLKKVSIEKRLKFARDHVHVPGLLEKIVFTDEKRFSFSGPDNSHKIWAHNSENLAANKHYRMLQYLF
eukprot:GAHX01000302.1.p2 GENE.GAHX01000302.1~~GAHX01000302.1.p2  ORF type:complete len:177 (-),score=25.65 GAHX01000302.1:512-1042(-)